MKPRVLKRSEEKVAEFKQDRQPRSDEDFLRDLGMGGDSEDRDIALAVRRAIASVG